MPIIKFSLKLTYECNVSMRLQKRKAISCKTLQSYSIGLMKQATYLVSWGKRVLSDLSLPSFL